ncbi:MAG: hypothetical protein KatS3mg085_669 [Candidatus Dojkabacteria bacterium]|nr:MAG: hypothetical protein KatS3mg085_669 [Candidatus Dojkabacteria bacterium]
MKTKIPKLKNINLKNFIIFLFLIKKELQYFFFTPIFFVISGLYIFIVFLIFFGIFRFVEFGTTNISPLFTASLFSFVFIVPALTMGAISKEKQLGTIEFVLNKPFSIFTFVLAKWLSASFIVGVLSILLLPSILFINSIEKLDLGQVSMQIFGVFLVGSAIASIGIAVSTYFKNEIPAFLLSLTICGLMVVIGSDFLRVLPFEFDSFLRVFGIYSHYTSLSRGVLDLRDLIYFLSLIILALSVSTFGLITERYPKNFTTRVLGQVSIFFFISIFGLVSFYGQEISGRADLTENKIYTLSEVTKNIIQNIENEKLKITLYTSSNLPIQFQKDLQSVKDILDDYESFSSGNIETEILYTDRDENAKEKAQSIGLREILFSVNSENSANRTIGYLGLGFEYQGLTESLELTEDVSSNLEFEITKKIKSLTDTNKLKVAFVKNNVARTRVVNYRILNQSLSEIYDVSDIELNRDTNLSEYNLVVLTSPNQAFEQGVLENLRSYFENGGRILLLVDTIEVPEQTFVPIPNEFSLKDLFEPYGVVVQDNLVYDLENNNQINLSSGLLPVIVDYPFWVRANTTQDAKEILKDLGNVSILWGSSIDVEDIEGVRVIVLLTTSASSNFQTEDNLNISTNQEFKPSESDKSLNLAVALDNNSGKSIVVGDSLFLDDDFLTQTNLNFALSSIEWLLDDTSSLSQISAKNRTPLPLELTNQEKQSLIAYSVISPLGFVGLVGVVIYVNRKRKEIKLS